jgi:hypothetical protein
MDDHGFALIDIQKAVYSVLSGDSVLAGLTLNPGTSWKIHDFVPMPEVYPYIVMGDDASDVIDVKDDGDHEQMEQTELTIHFYSRYRGNQEAKLAMQRVHALLNGREESMSVPFQEVVVFMRTTAACYREPDGKTIHGILKFTATTATGG